MAEKDIKKTPAATQTVQPSADKYTIQELEYASAKVFGVPRECAVAAFKGCKKTEMTVAEAKQIIDRFMKKEDEEMAGYFSLGENKIRPGAYFNVQKRGDETNFGAIDGVVAVLFKSSIGPLGKATVLPASEGYENTFGTGGTTDALREAFYGGAVKLIAVRVGNGGTVGSASLACATGKAKLSTKYPSGAKFTATIREKLGDSSKKECIVYLDGSEFEKVTFAAGTEEATALKEAFASSKNFVVDITDASGTVTAVSQSAFADGADPTVTNADYSAGLKEVEKYFFNTICVDTEDAAVHALVAAFLDRIYLAGSFGMAIVTPKPSSSLEDRMTSISSFDTENVIAPLNANANAGNEELKGYQVAAYIAGIVAATPANQSVTHATLSRYSVLNEILTNTEMEVAEEKGCLVLSTASDGAVWLDNGVNTLVHPDANHDSGWKKIRRTKTRYELLNRANAAADALVGKVDNDTNGRATIMAAIQGICNAMEAEGKIQYGNVTESTTVTTDGDTCGFDIEVIDLDSAEHIYLNYYFQFSTIVAASGE